MKRNETKRSEEKRERRGRKRERTFVPDPTIFRLAAHRATDYLISVIASAARRPRGGAITSLYPPVEPRQKSRVNWKGRSTVPSPGYRPLPPSPFPPCLAGFHSIRGKTDGPSRTGLDRFSLLAGNDFPRVTRSRAAPVSTVCSSFLVLEQQLSKSSGFFIELPERARKFRTFERARSIVQERASRSIKTLREKERERKNVPIFFLLARVVCQVGIFFSPRETETLLDAGLLTVLFDRPFANFSSAKIFAILPSWGCDSPLRKCSCLFRRRRKVPTISYPRQWILRHCRSLKNFFFTVYFR